ncbi:hypothetical protein MMPV_007290 [Pyropia vietnamensis]
MAPVTTWPSVLRLAGTTAAAAAAAAAVPPAGGAGRVAVTGTGAVVAAVAAAAAAGTPVAHGLTRALSGDSSMSAAATAPALSPLLPSTASPRFPRRNAADALSIRALLDARVHMGHRTSFGHPAMAPYLAGTRNGLHIFNLDTTLPLLRRALAFLSALAADGVPVMVLPPRLKANAHLVASVLSPVSGVLLPPARRWVGGTLTNPLASGQAARLGYVAPGALLVFDVRGNGAALREAAAVGLPTVGVVDTDCDPSGVLYPVPGNAEGAHALSLYAELAAAALREGAEKAAAADMKGGGGGGLPHRDVAERVACAAETPYPGPPLV